MSPTVLCEVLCVVDCKHKNVFALIHSIVITLVKYIDIKSMHLANCCKNEMNKYRVSTGGPVPACLVIFDKPCLFSEI